MDIKTLSNRVKISKNPIFCLNKPESYFSILLSFLFTIIVYFFLTTSGSDMSYINSTIKNILLNASFALLGVLGFLISGLAILSGTINSKVVNQIRNEKKYEDLMTVFTSFYHLGAVVGAYVIVLIFSYFFVSIEISYSFITYIILPVSFILAYGLFFIILYAVHLLKSCIAIFEISYIYSQKTEKNSVLQEYNEFIDLRLDTLLLALLKKNVITRNEFIALLEECIDQQYSHYSPSEKEELRNQYKKYYE